MPLKMLSSKSHTHFARYAEIIKALFKYGFDDIASSLRKKEDSSLLKILRDKDKEPSIQHMTRWRRIRMMLEELVPPLLNWGRC